jgi:hypothetical protein
MGLHGNAKLGLAGRRVMVMLVVGLGCRGGRRLHAAGCARRRRGRHAHATAWRALRRADLSRLPRVPREAARRYAWP